MIGAGVHIVKADIEKNRLYITLSGVIILTEAVKVKEQIVKAVETLKPGFDTINDLSKYIRGDEEAAPILKDVNNYLMEKKVNNIIRIVGQSKTGLMQFAKYTHPEGVSNIKYVPTREEADKLLDEQKNNH